MSHFHECALGASVYRTHCRKEIWFVLNMTKLKTTTLTNAFYYFFFLVVYDPKSGLSFRVYYFRFGEGQVGLVTYRANFMPQILSILQTRMRKFINIYFCYTSNLHNVQQEAQ